MNLDRRTLPTLEDGVVITPSGLRSQHHRLIGELVRHPFLPFEDPRAPKRREMRRRINRRLIEIEEQLANVRDKGNRDCLDDCGKERRVS